MPRLKGYQKKREYCREQNPDFFSVKPDRPHRHRESIIAEFERLDLIEREHKRKELELGDRISLREETVLHGAHKESKTRVSTGQTESVIANREEQSRKQGIDTGAHTVTRVEHKLCKQKSSYGIRLDCGWKDPMHLGRSKKSAEWNLENGWDESGGASVEKTDLISSEWSKTDHAWDRIGKSDSVEVNSDLADDGQGKWSTVKTKKRTSTAAASEKTAVTGCFNCGGPHKKADCPEPTRGKGACRNCNEGGHIAKTCPKERKATSAGGVCYYCGESGHIRALCPSNSDAGGGERSCYTCGSTDHIKRDCHNSSGLGVPAPIACYKCGEAGHMKQECPQVRSHVSTSRTCHNCGQGDHLNRECSEPRQDSSYRMKKQSICSLCGGQGRQTSICPVDAGERFDCSNDQPGFGTGRTDSGSQDPDIGFVCDDRALRSALSSDDVDTNMNMVGGNDMW